MHSNATFWDGVARKYARRPIRDVESYNRTLERVRSYLGAGDKVLELGCGTGSTALLLADHAGHITATDLSPGMIEIATEKARAQSIANVTFVRAEAGGASIDEGPFDVVMAFNLMHLLKEPTAVLRRVHGLLKPGGLFISKTPCNPEAGAPISYRLLRILLPVMQWLGKAPYVNFMSTREWEEFIASQGFEVIEVGSYPASPPSRFIVAKKT